jgi:hypothetical protein
MNHNIKYDKYDNADAYAFANKSAKSYYHFKNNDQDLRWDNVIGLGYIKPTWLNQLQEIVDNALPMHKTPNREAAYIANATGTDPRNISLKADVVTMDPFVRLLQQRMGVSTPPVDALDDAESKGAVVKTIKEFNNDIARTTTETPKTHFLYEIPPLIQQVSDLFALDKCMTRIHVQKPGEMWPLHFDALDTIAFDVDNVDQIMRITVNLSDWQPGHFWSVGNYIWQNWRAGDVTVIDHINVPHCTANTSHEARVTLQVTGVATAQTHAFLKQLKVTSMYHINKD